MNLKLLKRFLIIYRSVVFIINKDSFPPFKYSPQYFVQVVHQGRKTLTVDTAKVVDLVDVVDAAKGEARKVAYIVL